MAVAAQTQRRELDVRPVTGDLNQHRKDLLVELTHKYQIVADFGEDDYYLLQKYPESPDRAELERWAAKIRDTDTVLTASERAVIFTAGVRAVRIARYP